MILGTQMTDALIQRRYKMPGHQRMEWKGQRYWGWGAPRRGTREVLLCRKHETTLAISKLKSWCTRSDLKQGQKLPLSLEPVSGWGTLCTLLCEPKDQNIGKAVEMRLRIHLSKSPLTWLLLDPELFFKYKRWYFAFKERCLIATY